MKNIPLSSGATLGFQLARFNDGMNLFNATFKELVGIPFGAQGSSLDFANFLKMDISELKDIVIKVATSDKVQEAIWKCMESCTYQSLNDSVGIKITKNTFESEDARADFLLVVWEVATLNLVPFFKNLGSLLSTPLKGVDGNAPKSTTN